jgi:uncharacterized repeat protein (TIGR04138 family)
MQAADFEASVEKIVKKDPRYHRDAYLFVREALTHTQKAVGKASKSEERKPGGQKRHVTGQELLAGIRDYGLAQFGPMTMHVFNEWGLYRCEDFGEIVFNLVENDLLRKTDQDRRADFTPGYDFFEAFCRPFLPSDKAAQRVAQSQLN